MRGKNWFEWTVFALGVVLMLGLTAYLVRESIRREHGPPVVRVHVGPAEMHEGQLAVPLRLENLGHDTAAGVHVQVLLEDSAGARQEAAVTVDFLPGGASREAWVNLEAPLGADARATARVAGFGVP